MHSSIAAYTQTTDHTCADCTYMCARYELFNEPMNREKELWLWDQGCPKWLRFFHVTPPAFLTSFVQRKQKKESCTLHMFQKNLAPLKEGQTWMSLQCQLHDWVAKTFLGLKPRSVEYQRKQTTADLVAWLDLHPLVRIQQVIVIEGKLVHFLLIRRNDAGQIVVMDPLKDPNKGDVQNECFDVDGFEKKYGPVLFGYAMVHLPEEGQITPP